MDWWQWYKRLWEARFDRLAAYLTRLQDKTDDI
jgi:hypothetical protein